MVLSPEPMSPGGCSPAEAELVTACARGERWAQREVFERHHGSVYRAVLALTGNEAEAEEATQEAFLRAFEAIAGFEGRSKLRTWLSRIAVNAARQRLRKHRNRDRILGRAAASGEAPGLRLISSSRGDAPATGTLADLVRRAFEGLDRRDRTVLSLHVIEGYSYDEIAEILEIAQGTVGSRLSRARERLREAVLALDRDALGGRKKR